MTRMDVDCSVRESHPAEDTLLARHFYQMWLDNGIAADRIKPDWEERVLAFVRIARRDLQHRAFVAELHNGNVVGSGCCQIFAGLYPDILESSARRYGYISGVYVERAYRRRGVARRLTLAATTYLASIGCTHALLHASPPGQPLYASLGFQPTNEMRLPLTAP
jgi:ribosomal protein S18 acetylase RimI-like enzyme